jgi:hypothetical protein
MRVDGESRLPRAAWQLLCLSENGFEGCYDRRLCFVGVCTPIEGVPVPIRESPHRGEFWRHRHRRGDVLSAQGAIAPGMAPQRRGWPHSAGGGGEDVLRVIRVVAPPTACARSPPVHLSRVSPCQFEGLVVGGGQELAAQFLGMTLACPHRVAWYLHGARDGLHSDRVQPHSDGVRALCVSVVRHERGFAF